MKNIILTLVLILINWIALLGQGGVPVKCYTQEELNQIADQIIFAQEADSLRKVAEQQLQILNEQTDALNNALASKQNELDAEKSIVIIKDNIISGKDIEIKGLRESLKQHKKKLKWTNIGWISTSGILTTIILLK